ncbi:DUF5908 family protein [Fulvivirga sp. M361]|uniref:DUF5908 family protein n=1 Tax=Fulvivirga sp. M361 TaxID=2594266 RepID=UPI0016297FE5|nr:DUF5908 family protein [Fulvivirga sp. M361]
MPIEIKELTVKLTVTDSHNLPVRSYPQARDAMAEKRIIEECVDRVLRVIEARKER